MHEDFAGLGFTAQMFNMRSYVGIFTATVCLHLEWGSSLLCAVRSVVAGSDKSFRVLRCELIPSAVVVAKKSFYNETLSLG